jgi:hypothetical protein
MENVDKQPNQPIIEIIDFDDKGQLRKKAGELSATGYHAVHMGFSPNGSGDADFRLARNTAIDKGCHLFVLRTRGEIELWSKEPVKKQPDKA